MTGQIWQIRFIWRIVHKLQTAFFCLLLPYCKMKLAWALNCHPTQLTKLEAMRAHRHPDGSICILPVQGHELQGLLSVGLPSHLFPPCLAWRETALLPARVPPSPHVTEHGPQSHRPHAQSWGAREMQAKAVGTH